MFSGLNVNIVQSSLATMQVQVPVKVILNGSTNYNPTADVVEFAFVAPGAIPVNTDWKNGTWVTDPGPTYVAQCLVGPTGGTVNLSVGVYTVWLKVIDNPEIFVPAGGVGTLTIE